MSIGKRAQEIVDSGFRGIAGTVSVDEYDWKIQIAIAIARFEQSGEVFQEFDIGKIVGIARYVSELEKELNGRRDSSEWNNPH